MFCRLAASRNSHQRRFSVAGVLLFLVWGLACSSPVFRSPNADLFMDADCDDKGAQSDTIRPVSRFLANKEQQTVLIESWMNPRERPKDVDTLPQRNCTVYDEAHWSCSFNGDFFSASFSRSGDVVKGTYDQPNKGASRFSASCYQKM